MYPGNPLSTALAAGTLLLLLLLAGAAPLVYTQLAGGRYNNKCGAATFRGRTSGASPAAADCRAVAARYGGFDGGWHLSGLPTGAGGVYQTLASHGGCAFGVRPRDAAFHSLYVGDVRCGSTPLEWGIYRV